MLEENIARGTKDPDYSVSRVISPEDMKTYLVTRWRHLYWFQIGPLVGATCINYKYGNQVAQLALPHIDCPVGIIRIVLSWYLHKARVTSVKLQQQGPLQNGHPDPHIRPE